MDIPKAVLDEGNSDKLLGLGNRHVLGIVEEYANLCRPEKISVITDSKEDINYVRELAIKSGEEMPLAMQGHTVHFDGYHDQGRDRENTKVLVSDGQTLGKAINTADREKCLEEISGLLRNIMAGKEMLVRFFCLAPVKSRFSICALQLTDSAYVAHSEDILYRAGYEEFRRLGGSSNFFHFVHSSGELENGISKNISKRRIYMDLEGNRVFTINCQYAGNSVGLKKLALRLAIKKSHLENWLCEHMLIIGVRPEGKNRTTYFTGAFPSACGKTSTAMIPGQTIVGDDIAYLMAGNDGRAYAANAEQGIFGIIEEVNPSDDPLIYKALTTPREMIFSNVLIADKNPYWLGMGRDIPVQGRNYAGNWELGNKDATGKEILPAHRNARYTIRLGELENVDQNLHNPDGVPVSGIIYGGRDSDTSPPVLESFGWPHGVFIGAALESETTAATLGQTGVREHNPMANLDFLVIPLGTYIENHLKFGLLLDKPPRIFATNYFLKENGEFLNRRADKKAWLAWMEARVHNECNAIETPIGLIPRFEDLKELFKMLFNREFAEKDYERQFSIRAKKLLERLDRIEGIYRAETNVPEVFKQHIGQQRRRLLEAVEKHKKEVILPSDFE